MYIHYSFLRRVLLYFRFSYRACEVFPLVAAHCFGAQVHPNSSLVNFKQLWHSILKLVLLDVSIYLEREREDNN